MNILLYGYGNPGRQDDGLGIKFIEIIEKWIIDEKIKNVEVDTNYQLNVEDALTISDKDFVIFADASLAINSGYDFVKVNSDDSTIEFTMHAVSPAYILDLCNKIYNKNPQTYLLHIKGYKWELKEEITPEANENLLQAVEFTKAKIIELLYF